MVCFFDAVDSLFNDDFVLLQQQLIHSSLPTRIPMQAQEYLPSAAHLFNDDFVLLQQQLIHSSLPTRIPMQAQEYLPSAAHHRTDLESFP